MAKTIEQKLRSCLVSIESVAPYSSSKKHEEPKLAEETHDEYDSRTWRHKLTTDSNGMVVISSSAFKQAVDGAAKMVCGKIPGGGSKTYTKLFVTGVIVEDNAPLGVHANEVEGERLFVNADGVRGSGKRVFRTFPTIYKWKTKVPFLITDPTLPESEFEKAVVAAGRCMGVGMFRPERGGSKGRFTVTSFEWGSLA